MFPGTNPFEATEAKTFADFARNLSAEGTPVVGLLDFHSYSQQSKLSTARLYGQLY